MLNDASRAQGSASDARQCVEHCLRTLLAVTPSELKSPDLRSALIALQGTLQGLLAKDNSERVQTKSAPQDNSPLDEVQIDSDSADLGDSSEAREHSQTKHWRARVKTSAEKLEKKARLEKREAILRDLRSRVTQFRDEQVGHDSVTAKEFETSGVVSFETFEMRRHRASFWPEGSADWARQLLGIELGMTQAEKRQRYVEMVRVCHPDQNHSVPPDAIKLVNAAWEVVR
jgi:hypothetical protein